ncbi:DeoR/GlpR family DNA-binding transcription regulator [Bacillus piscicola]|uniref:DeoR/GlpR family DNA-binding transcription regulator n=1 Tax=Bacillus piscicola TaxID=1632684 RepID=UPI001F09B487|nr:DeoR/GlpR family DNA-binding transcription regulator [Bacillus piscicola]
MSLLSEERKQYILRMINEHGQVRANELAQELGVSTETIRRDLDQLDNENKLKKVHGGAVKSDNDLIEPSHYMREHIYIEEKRMIGITAASLVHDNEIIIIDEGSTTLQMIPYLLDKKNITLITNSLPALTLLVDYKTKGLFNGEFIFIGGHVDADHLRVSGMIAEQFMHNFHADKAFISLHGVTKDHGASSYNADEAILSKTFMDCAEEKIVLFDHSKINKKKFYRIASLAEYDTVISDALPPSDWEDHLESNHIKWMTVDVSS